jgi:hypothetical protein
MNSPTAYEKAMANECNIGVGQVKGATAWHVRLAVLGSH